MNPESTQAKTPSPSHTATTILVTVLCTLGVVIATYWLVSHYVFPKQFAPVALSATETHALNRKLQAARLPGLTAPAQDSPVEPEPYREDDSKRLITFTEREINGLLAQNTDLARRMAIDFSDHMASVVWLLPLDPEFPLLGGQTLKLNAGIELAYRQQRPVVKLRGVSLWGVPLPDAWLGNLKNIDLIDEFGGDPGFWKSFAEGIAFIEVQDDTLTLKLRP